MRFIAKTAAPASNVIIPIVNELNMLVAVFGNNVPPSVCVVALSLLSGVFGVSVVSDSSGVFCVPSNLSSDSTSPADDSLSVTTKLSEPISSASNTANVLK